MKGTQIRPMINEDQVRTVARQVVSEMIGYSLSDSEPLISSGLIDSLSIFKLIALLEQKLNVSIPPGNLQPEDFDNVDWIVDTVTRVAHRK
jgi:acyl carrier protein